MNIKLPMKIVLGIIAVFAIIAVTQIDFTKEENKTDTTPQEQPKSLMHVAAHTNNLSDFTAAVKMAELADSLTNGGPYTVFAPTNRAFAQMPEGMYASIMGEKDQNELAEIFKGHIVSGRLKAEDLTDGQTVRTLQGTSYTITVQDDSLMIGDATIVKSGLHGSNGIIHTIDAVLIPADQ